MDNEKRNLFIIVIFLIPAISSILFLQIYAQKEIVKFKTGGAKKGAAISSSVKPTLIPKDSPKENVSLAVDDDKFNPSIIRVKTGNFVTIVLLGKEGFHNFVLPPYSVVSAAVTEGKSTKFFFVATESGTFEFHSYTGRYNESEPSGTIVIE